MKYLWYLYVNDLFVIGSSLEFIHKFREEMKEVLEMKDLGKMTFFLGTCRSTKNKMNFLFANKKCKRNPQENRNPTTTPLNKEKFCKEDGAEKVDERL